MASSLKKVVKDHYESKSLSKGQLDNLMQLQPSPKKFKLSKFAIPLSIAASFLFLLMGNFFISQDSIREKIIEEVAYNHHKKKEPEILTASISKIQEKLDRLDFSIVKPTKISSNDWIIIGGRYCSIQGKIAAQLKVKNRNTKIVYTLYEWPAQKDWNLDDIIGATKAADGVIVDIWWEKGLLFALAGSVEE